MSVIHGASALLTPVKFDRGKQRPRALSLASVATLAHPAHLPALGPVLDLLLSLPVTSTLAPHDQLRHAEGDGERHCGDHKVGGIQVHSVLSRAVHFR